MSIDSTFLRDLDLARWHNRFSLGALFSKKSRATKDILADVYRSRKVESLGELMLIDQGTRLDDAPLAIPLLARLIPLVDDAGKVRIIDDLVLLGVAFEEECLGFRGVEECCAFHAQCYDLVSEEVWRFTELLTSSNDILVDAACRAVAWFSKAADVDLPMLATKASPVALVARGLLGDSSIEIVEDSLKSKFVSNASFCFVKRADRSNLEIFLEMSRVSQSKDMSLAPFEFDLTWFSAEAIHRQHPKFIESCISELSDGPLKNCVTAPQHWRKKL